MGVIKDMQNSNKNITITITIAKVQMINAISILSIVMGRWLVSKLVAVRRGGQVSCQDHNHTENTETALWLDGAWWTGNIRTSNL